jgi:hypothetical protein
MSTAPKSAEGDMQTKQEEPLTPSVGVASPRASSRSTPGMNDQGSKFKLFEKTPLDRSTNGLSQNVSTAPPFLRNQSEPMNTIPPELVNINLALGALDLDFGNHNKAEKDADLSTSSANEGEEEISEEDIQQQLFGPGLVPQAMQFFPMNEFGQPLHSTFPGEHMSGTRSPVPWAHKPGQPPFGAVMGTNLRSNLSGMSPSPIPPPGMIPMGPFDFHGEPMRPVHPIQHGQLPPHEAFQNSFGMKGPVMKDGQFNQNFPGMENIPFNGSQQQLKNNQMWPPLNSRNGNDQVFSGATPHSNIISHDHLPHDRRYPYYQNRNNMHDHHHHHHHNNHGGRRMGGNRPRGEDSSRFDNAKLDDFIGQIYSLCKDQHGCRFLQKQLDIDAANATPIFEETQMHIVELMIDPFGNYLVQKLLEKVNDEERITLVKNATPEFISIALDPHGTRALQKLVEFVNSEVEAKLIVKALSNDVVLLSRDLNGNHVIQKCLHRLKPEDSQFIFDAADEHCLEIATHRHGCCVLQRCLDHGSQEQCKKLSEIIAKHTIELSSDAYGNYVVQYVLAKNDKDIITEIVKAIKGDFISLCLQKFGSNVIEKCFKSTTHAPELIDELLNNENELLKLLNDPYGNYVIQTALNVAEEVQFEQLSLSLKPLLPQVKNTPHGRRILSRLQPNGRPQYHNHQRVSQVHPTATA